ncbi:PdxA family dehydrogenase [Rhodoplanes sp. Z2-YC6860]|uniref:PdxA family dehydrogenase n=1 Tax=Rhodoplanes sp. Z2-YC6860 TaxID=674703 RepID=UPI00078EBC14|nr:4-hydroxythreonine-4-phosphate dehydrogenase PdxA [Rhodoplanes sp. Z2-YC6860]AMN38616.1 4-hydroxythreonine-4-phosphate dehydrogenase [Rhodoplanes sp. Z2-YC6860]
MAGRVKIAIPVGDPAGIGPEICLKAVLDLQVRAACDPIIVCDEALLARHAKACGLDAALSTVKVLACPQPETASLGFGVTAPAAGRASIAFCAAAVNAAMTGEVDAVVAAPQNETSIAQAGIQFDGHPSFVARQTRTNEEGVYMMLCFGDTRIAHCTLHRSVKDSIALITKDNVARTIRATNVALQRMGIAQPKIAVSGLNPHAGEGGLFGREEIEIIRPAMDTVAAEGIAVSGPYGADTMFHMPGFDAFVVMLHDQGHIATKLLAQNAAAALTIGTPILFASVAHGTGHDIAGKGIANPAAMIEAVLRMAKAKKIAC